MTVPLSYRWLRRSAVLLHVACLACVTVLSCAGNRTTEDAPPEFYLAPWRDPAGATVAPANPKPPLRLKELKLSAQLTKEQVLTDWGPPYGVGGFGVEYLVYKLDDGRELWLHFADEAPRPLLWANVEHKGIFRGLGMKRIPLR